MSIRVLLCDDQALVRGGFQMIIDAREDLEVVGEAENGRQAVELARRLDPDVVLMDVRMPELDGVAATRELVAGGARARVLILTTFDLDETSTRRSGPAPAGSCSRTCGRRSSPRRSGSWPAARRCWRRR